MIDTAWHSTALVRRYRDRLLIVIINDSAYLRPLRTRRPACTCVKAEGNMSTRPHRGLTAMPWL